jgi:hypothetical protein
MLAKRSGRNRDLHPFASPRDDQEGRHLGICDPHVVPELDHVLLGGRAFRERPRQHELGLVDRSGLHHHTVEGGRHPGNDRVLDAGLRRRDGLPRVALEPRPVEVLCGEAELDDEVRGEVLRPDLAPFLPPEAGSGPSASTFQNLRKTSESTAVA